MQDKALNKEKKILIPNKIGGHSKSYYPKTEKPIIINLDRLAKKKRK